MQINNIYETTIRFSVKVLANNTHIRAYVNGKMILQSMPVDRMNSTEHNLIDAMRLAVIKHCEYEKIDVNNLNCIYSRVRNTELVGLAVDTSIQRTYGR